jgi:two-component system, cell cycle sensor histidine kinase and response regulator CckA
MILVVEDDPLVAGITCRMLEEDGHPSRRVSSAREALRLVESRTMSPRLLVLDVRLPDMSGLRLAERLEAILPGIPILFVTGYPDVYAELASEGRRTFLAKPFEFHQLSAAVRRLLSQPGSSSRTAS